MTVKECRALIGGSEINFGRTVRFDYDDIFQQTGERPPLHARDLEGMAVKVDGVIDKVEPPEAN